MLYTLRRTWPEDDKRPDDFVVRCDARDVGRIYRGIFAGQEHWAWTIYIFGSIKRAEGVPIQGRAPILDQAKQEFRRSFERMVVT